LPSARACSNLTADRRQFDQLGALGVGAALTLAYALQWVWVILSGSPLPMLLLAPALVVQAVLAAAAVYHLAGRPSAAAEWAGLPGFVVIAVAWWMLAWVVPQGLAGDLRANPAGAPLAAVLVLALVLLTPAVLAYPSAAVAGDGATRLALRAIGARGRGRRLACAAAIIALASLWTVAEQLLSGPLTSFLPYPAFAAFLFGLLHAVGWSLALGLPILLFDPGVSSAGRTAKPWIAHVGAGNDTARAGNPRRGPGTWFATALLGVAVLGAAALSASLPLAPLAAAATSHVQASSRLALAAVPLPALRQGGAALAETYAAKSLIAGMEGDHDGARKLAAAGVWWSPVDIAALRVDGWQRVLYGRTAEARAGIIALRTAGDGAGADQLSGIWLGRRGGNGREYLMRALVTDSLLSLQLPGGPPPAVGGFDGQRRVLDSITEAQRRVFTNLVGELAGKPSVSAAAATDLAIRHLMADGPATDLRPAYEQDLMAAYTHALGGDVPGAVSTIVASFKADRDLDHRRHLAEAGIRLASGGVSLDAGAVTPLVTFAGEQGDDKDRLAVVIFLMSRGDHQGTVRAAESLVARGGEASTRAQALALEAEALYELQQYQAAIDKAQASLSLKDDTTFAMAHATIGNSRLNLVYPKIDAAAEADILAAANREPHAFLLWHTLGQMEASQRHFRKAVDYETNALAELQQLSSQGLGNYTVVVSTPPNSGRFYPLSSGYGYRGLAAVIASDISELQKQAPG
jgi:hypothetical protein